MPNSIVVEQGFQCPSCSSREDKDLLVEARFVLHKPVFNEVILPGENNQKFSNVPFVHICVVGCNRCIQELLIRELEGTLDNYRNGIYDDSVESPPVSKFAYARFVNTICRQSDASEYHGKKMLNQTGIIINGLLELHPMKMTRFDKIPSCISRAIFEACEHCFRPVITSSEHSSVNTFIKSVLSSLEDTDFSDPATSATGNMLQKGIRRPE